MHRIIRKSFNQAGDTIIEVMLAVAVVGMVIGGSYVIATRAQRTGRYAQEQTEALKQAESQIERLKHLASQGLTSGSNWIFNGNAGNRNFCINDSFNKILVSDTTPVTGYNSVCKGKGNGGLYSVLVEYVPGATPPNTEMFNVKVTWERQGTDSPGLVTIAYKLHNEPTPAP